MRPSALLKSRHLDSYNGLASRWKKCPDVLPLHQRNCGHKWLGASLCRTRTGIFRVIVRHYRRTMVHDRPCETRGRNKTRACNRKKRRRAPVLGRCFVVGRKPFKNLPLSPVGGGCCGRGRPHSALCLHALTSPTNVLVGGLPMAGKGRVTYSFFRLTWI